MSQRQNRVLEHKRKFWSIPLILLMALALLLSDHPAGAKGQNDFEPKPELKASSLLGPELLKSDLYTVDEVVINDGLLNHFTVRSRFGVFRTDSTQATVQLLHEIRAIAVMKRVETKDTAVDSVVQSGKNAVTAISDLATDPVTTLEGAAAGVNSLFHRATQVIGKRKTTNAEDTKVEQFIGKSKSKGDIANKFGVSVYSLNPVLQEELDRLAWADYLGGLSVGFATSAVPGLGGAVLTASGAARLLNQVINTTPAAELWVRNKNKLQAMLIDEDTTELYLNNPSFTPALQTVMVEALEDLQGVDNKILFIKISLQANTHRMARIITEITTMTAGFHKNVEPLKTLAPFGRMLYATTRKGAAILLLPADYVSWNDKVADAATWLLEPKANQAKPSAMQMWILGTFSEKAKNGLQSLGWELHPAAQSILLPDSTSKP